MRTLYYDSASPVSRPHFLIFAQESQLNSNSLVDAARRFFRADLVITRDDVAGLTHLELRNKDGSSELRIARMRDVADGDLDLATSLERPESFGLALLASRCKTVWELDGNDERNRPSLLLAAILASVALGPIIPPSRDAIYGVKTARIKLDL